MNFVVPRTNVGRIGRPFPLSHDEDEVVLRKLSISDFLVHRIAFREVDITPETGVVQLRLHLRRVLVENGANWYDDGLARVQPERPFATEVFGQDGDHSLERTEDGPVNHDGPLLLARFADIAQIEAERQLEVQLDRGALVLTVQGVLKPVGNGNSLNPTMGYLIRARYTVNLKLR